MCARWKAANILLSKCNNLPGTKATMTINYGSKQQGGQRIKDNKCKGHVYMVQTGAVLSYLCPFWLLNKKPHRCHGVAATSLINFAEKQGLLPPCRLMKVCICCLIVSRWIQNVYGKMEFKRQQYVFNKIQEKIFECNFQIHVSHGTHNHGTRQSVKKGIKIDVKRKCIWSDG